MSVDVLVEYDRVPRKHRNYDIDWLHPDDIEQIIKLEKEWFLEPLTMSKLNKLINEPNTCYIVVRDGKKVIGYIGFQLFLAMAHTISMGVDARYRRENLAIVIQKTADAVAKKRGARWFTGEVRVSNEPQLKFLSSIGWHEVGICRNFFANKEDAIVVWNWL